MEVVAVSRADGDFQRRLDAGEIEAVCRRVLGADAALRRAVELAVGTYNTTYRLEVGGGDLILRVGPASAEDDSEGGLRNGYAAAPYFAALGDLAPTTVGADFTRQVVDRDVVLQRALPGVPADERLGAWSSAQRRDFYRQVGEVTRAVHAVTGTRFGLVGDPRYATWSAAVEAQLTGLRAAYADRGLDPAPLDRLVAAVAEHRPALDAVTTPSLLHGDLWTLNLLVAADSDEPRITGVVDLDTARWGDPLADWPIHQAQVRAGSEADAFWDGYGATVPEDGPAAIRQLFYRARLLAGARLDIDRRGIDLATVPPVHWDLEPVVRHLDL